LLRRQDACRPRTNDYAKLAKPGRKKWPGYRIAPELAKALVGWRRSDRRSRRIGFVRFSGGDPSVLSGVILLSAWRER
jgi:hypothetical protein